MNIDIAVGRSRETKVWKNEQVSWPSLVSRLSKTIRTPESYREYISFSKERQQQIKDQGGFVGGFLTGGKRSPSTVKHRQVLTLDLDTANTEFWLDFKMLFDETAVLHSTHKHSTKTPRYRLVMPLDREVAPEEYEAIARRVAKLLNIDLFDPTTFQPMRLMFWPTSAKDGDYIFREQKGEWLSADRILSTYHDWTDMSEWPMHLMESDFTKLGGKQQGDPSQKPGIIGAFCRTYSISAAIEMFLSDIYIQCDTENRYTFKDGQGHAGAIVYNDEFLYSHHGSDPAHMRLLNAFDLVRIHKFGYEDNGEKELSKQKSQNLMKKFASEDQDVVGELGIAKLQNSDFDDGFEDLEWLKKLDVDKFGDYDTTIANFYRIATHDSQLTGKLVLNDFAHRHAGIFPLPWDSKSKGLRDFDDDDDAGLRQYIEEKYGIYHATKSKDGIRSVFKNNAFHPIRDYINGLKWDGVNRIETLLVDYFRAEDTEFTRAACRKWLTAAVARVFHPGCKFDYTLVLVGKQGIKKSTFFDILGKEWFSDSFMGVQGKEAYEQLQGVWIIEIGELAGIKKADIDAVKSFVVKRKDRFRVPYGVRPEDFARQCVFGASTNENDFLKDYSGNRRFWPVQVYQYGEFDVKDMPVDQIWAEAKIYYDNCEPLYLDPLLEEQAGEVQKAHTEIDDRKGMIEAYLNTLLPENWSTYDIYERRNYLNDSKRIAEEGEFIRVSVCVAEIWCELLRGELKDMGPHNTKYYHQIMKDIQGWGQMEKNMTFPLYGRQRAYGLFKEEITGVNKRIAKKLK